MNQRTELFKSDSKNPERSLNLQAHSDHQLDNHPPTHQDNTLLPAPPALKTLQDSDLPEEPATSLEQATSLEATCPTQEATDPLELVLLVLQEPMELEPSVPQDLHTHPPHLE